MGAPENYLPFDVAFAYLGLFLNGTEPFGTFLLTSSRKSRYCTVQFI